MITEGERVFAASSMDETTVYLFGYGVYRGYQPVEAGTPSLFGIPAPDNYTNPLIELDNGKTVRGYECWWGSESKLPDMIKGRTVVMVDIDEYRAKVRVETKS